MNGTNSGLAYRAFNGLGSHTLGRAVPGRASRSPRPSGPQGSQALKPSSSQGHLVPTSPDRAEPGRASRPSRFSSPQALRPSSSPQGPRALMPSSSQARAEPSRAGPSFEILKALRPSRPSRSPSLQALKLARSSRPVMKSGKSEREPATNLGLGSRKSEC